MICRDPKCCQDFDVNPIHLIRPDLLDADGRAFLDAHGIDLCPLYKLQDGATVNENGTVKIRHRCDQLGHDGRCLIYEDRPQICRDFDCSTRVDCACRQEAADHDATTL